MFRERITRHYQSLSTSFKKIADFILVSHQRTAFMSASRLAKHLGVDVATVTRFAQQIGYEGYTELIREIQEKVLEELREARAPVTERIEAAQGPVAQILWRDWANLEKTIQNISLEYADQSVKALHAAGRIYLAAEGMGIALAQAAANYLSMTKAEVTVLAQGPFDSALALKEIGPQDVVIGIGFTSYDLAAARAVEIGRNAGATTIGITAQADCPIGKVADLLFACAVTEAGYLPSLTSVGSVLFALVYGVSQTDPDGYRQGLMRFQETYADLTKGTTRGDEDVVEDMVGLS